MPIQCFIIMPFADEFLPIRDAIRDAVESASDGGRAIRADDIFRPGNVVAQVQNAIRAADFCVADVTGNNPNVMWEAGFASALGKSVVAVRQNAEQPPFNIRVDRIFQYQRERLDDLRDELKKVSAQLLPEIEANPPPLGWRYDEITELSRRLRLCTPLQQGRDLLSLLGEAVRVDRNEPWARGDEARLMAAIQRVQSSPTEHQNAFWWLTVHGLFGYDQIRRFQSGASNGVQSNLELVDLTPRGIAFLEWLRQRN